MDSLAISYALGFNFLELLNDLHIININIEFNSSIQLEETFITFH